MPVRTCLIYDIKKYAIHDGPGIRTTVFFKGCPLSCRWCHNPEGISPVPHLVHHPDKCMGCGLCCDACPQNALELTVSQGSKRMVINQDICRTCGDCTRACPAGAMALQGQVITVSGLADIMLKDRIFYDSSGGGVTFSGGEPLAQGEALIDLLTRCKADEIHTTVDTSGFSSRGVLTRVSALADLFLYDLKLIDDERHRQYTGVSNQMILSNLEYLMVQGAEVLVRIPLIPGVNDRKKDLEEFAGFLSGLDPVPPVEILPYHDFHWPKYDKLGIPYKMKGTLVPSRAQVEEAGGKLEQFGLAVQHQFLSTEKTVK